jgi:hypothetical protein
MDYRTNIYAERDIFSQYQFVEGSEEDQALILQFTGTLRGVSKNCFKYFFIHQDSVSKSITTS